MSIPAITFAGGAAATTPASSPVGAGSEAHGGSFADALKGLVESAEESGTQANDAVGQMLNKTGDVHDAMIALQRAEMSLQLTVQIRNKIVQAYQDIMRMPV